VGKGESALQDLRSQQDVRELEQQNLKRTIVHIFNILPDELLTTATQRRLLKKMVVGRLCFDARRRQRRKRFAGSLFVHGR